MADSIGLQMYTLRRVMDRYPTVEGVYKKVKEMGYNAVQGGPAPGQSMKDFKKMLDDIGLKPLSTYGNLLNLLKDPKPAIENARILGVKSVDIATVYIENRSSLQGYRDYAFLINKVGKELAKEGLHLSYHNHALEFHNFEGHKTGFDVLVEETDPDALWFCLDCHWLTGAGNNPVKVIKRLKGRMSMIHFKDYDIDLGTTVIEVTPRLFKAVGEGNIDWPPIVEACHEVGIHDFVVEQDECERDPYDCAASSARYLKTILDV